MIPDKDRIRGSLIGGAIGDALGYPVEFIYDYRTIQKKYGEKGITRYDTRHWWKDEREQDGKAWVSDDTQMTLFTACGLLNAQADIAKTTLDPDTIRKHMICSAYLEWYYTQIGKPGKKPFDCWIRGCPEINQRRAPGNTCLGAAIGYEALPEFYKKDLELHDVIIHVADDLYEGKVSNYH